MPLANTEVTKQVEVIGVLPPGNAILSGVVTGFLGRPVVGATVELNGGKIITDVAGNYAFSNIATGVYTIKVTSEPWYSQYQESVTLTEGTQTKNVSLGVKPYILFGVPIAAFTGMGATVALATRKKVK